MSKGIFTDRNHCPLMEEIFAALGPRQKRREELNHYMRENYQVEGELVFGGANDGWAQRYRRSGRTLLQLLPGRDALIANVVVGRSLLKKAEALQQGSNARHVLETAKRLYEGCWLYVKVSSAQDIRDIQQLIALKAKPRPLREHPASVPHAA